jgi:hypothetical protein
VYLLLDQSYFFVRSYKVGKAAAVAYSLAKRGTTTSSTVAEAATPRQTKLSIFSRPSEDHERGHDAGARSLALFVVVLYYAVLGEGPRLFPLFGQCVEGFHQKPHAKANT